jgi:hypothetical protein
MSDTEFIAVGFAYFAAGGSILLRASDVAEIYCVLAYAFDQRIQQAVILAICFPFLNDFRRKVVQVNTVDADTGKAGGPQGRIEMNEFPTLFQRPVREMRSAAFAAPLIQAQHIAA